MAYTLVIVTMSTAKLNTPIDCAELDDIAHINVFLDSLSDEDVQRLIGDGINRAPIKPFHPIR